jgi:hypothetical protein
MTVEVNVHDTSGPVVSNHVRNVPLPSQSSAGDDPDLELRIQSIVAQNAGHPMPTSLSHTVAGSAP